jgi:uncharacterized membrane protein YfcA
MVTFIVILFLGALIAGFLGSLTGLGGGVVIVPLLTIGFGVDIRYAIGTSLISVIATSSGAASAYVKEGILNIRIGMFLEIATTVGAIVGAAIFGFVLIYSAVVSFQTKDENIISENLPEKKSDRMIGLLKAKGTFMTANGPKNYIAQHLGGGFIVMILAGILSGLLGIGSGALKVIAMDSIMKIPFKVSTSTSNFMIGVTAAASAGIYLNRGYIDPVLSMPVMVGVLIGSLVGAKILLKSRSKNLRFVFAIVITLLALEMIYNGLAKNI